MRILALTNLYPNPYQPHRASFNRQQFRSLAARHPFAVIAPIAWTDELAARRRGAARLPPGRRVALDGIDVEHPLYVYPPGVMRGWYGHFYLRSVRDAFARLLGEFRPDLIYATWAYPDGWAGVELGRRAGLPVVVKVHGSDVLTAGRHRGRRGPMTEALRRADAVVAVSQDLADRVGQLGVDRERIRVVYSGVDADRFHPGPKEAARARLGLERKGTILLAVGNLVPIKGFDILVDACCELAAAGVPFTCHLIGQGPLRATLERQVARLGLRGRVELAGARPHDQLADWYRAADVVVLPSRSEGVPNVLLEAAACGTPFVASRVGGVPEVAHLGVSRLVPPDDPGRLAGAVTDLLGATPGLPAPSPPRGQAEVVSELSALFDRTLRGHGRPPGTGSEPCRPGTG